MNPGPTTPTSDRVTILAAADPRAVAQAADVIRAGGLVAFPTETVYGLGADATSGVAVAKIYQAKDRPQFNPLISHVPDLAAAEREGLFDAQARALAEAFWPGPLTLVVPASPTCRISDLARAGLPSVALRVPAHPVARDLLIAAGLPVAAPSANRSGRISPTHAAHVMGDLDGRIDMVLDGGPTQVGLESTIVACLPEGVRLLRPGGIARASIEEVLGAPLLAAATDAGVTAPGMLASHYAPHARLRLNATQVEPEEAVLDFGGRFAHVQAASFDLSPRGNLVEAATHLFAFLRALDATGAETIAVAPIPHDGLGEAINDRLARAAAPR
ncbi:MAG: Sua5/YciO/YrdC/YwlC family protein [Hyphomicrobiales bacterium]|nr:Sua5/YciO/YrdC/YwlC family protein [Hyphomicrobiales bacterium]